MPRFYKGKIIENALEFKPKTIFDIKVDPHIKECLCSVCGKKDFVVPGSKHEQCRGFRIVKPLPQMFEDLRNPDNIGFFEVA